MLLLCSLALKSHHGAGITHVYSQVKLVQQTDEKTMHKNFIALYLYSLVSNIH